MPTSKRARVQTYLPPELAEAVRQRAIEEDRPESREIARLVQLGLEADAKAYTLGGRVFRTKADIQAHVRAVREATPLGERITDTAVLALLSLHPDWEEKTAGGGWIGTAMIHHPSQAKPSKQIAVLFHDSDKVVDISWARLIPLLQRGITPHLKSNDCGLQEFRLAARYEIEEQIKSLRSPGYSVDHVYPVTFEHLLYNWTTANKLRVSDVTIEYAAPPKTHRRFADRVLANSWQTYHKMYAVLECKTFKEHTACTQRSNIDWSDLL